MSASPGPQSAQHCPIVQSCWESNKTSDDVRQSFSTFLLHRNLPQMYALLMEPYPMIQVSILWQPHRTMVANFVSGKFGLFQRNLWQALSVPWGSAELRLKKKTDVRRAWLGDGVPSQLLLAVAECELGLVVLRYKWHFCTFSIFIWKFAIDSLFVSPVEWSWLNTELNLNTEIGWSIRKFCWPIHYNYLGIL